MEKVKITQLSEDKNYLKKQIDVLADYIMTHFHSDIKDGGAVDIAINIMDRLKEKESRKVKITPEQERALKLAIADYGSDRVMDAIKGQWSTKKLIPLNKLTPHQLARAIYIGYEVEPEYKVGDWVVVVTHEDAGYVGVTAKITNANALKRYPIGLDFDNENQVFKSSEIRHATPQEIATEKERRFFDRNGRKPWELKRGDTLSREIYSSYTVWEINDDGVKFNEFGIFKTWNEVKEEFKVSCFAHDRKDI